MATKTKAKAKAKATPVAKVHTKAKIATKWTDPVGLPEFRDISKCTVGKLHAVLLRFNQWFSPKAIKATLVEKVQYLYKHDFRLKRGAGTIEPSYIPK